MNHDASVKHLAEEQKLIQMAQTGDKPSLTALLERYRPLVVSSSHRFCIATDSILSREELIQSGYLGLITAISRYEKEKDTLLGTYALSWILGEMKRTIKNSLNRMGEYDHAAKIKRMQSQFEIQYSRSPTISEISSACRIPVWQIAHLLNACDTGQYEDESSDGIKPAGFTNASPDIEQTTEFSLALEALTKEERQVVLMRYYRDCTQSETAKLIGKSQTQVSRIERSALDHLKRMLS